MLITADKIFNGQQMLTNTTVEIIDGKISAIYPEKLEQAQQLKGTLTAGFIDYHVNGGGGQLFNFAPNADTLTTMVKAHAKFGTTALLPTLITDSVDVMQQAANAVATAMKKNALGILGIHFEGPHLSIPKKGVHEAVFVRALSDTEKNIFERNDLGIKLITIAPENVSNNDIEHLLNTGMKVSVGHSNASYQRAKEVVRIGVDGFTHLFNAMSAFTSREPGVLGAGLESNSAYCGIILDGHHVHYASAKIAYQSKPKGKLLIVTDAMSTVGANQKSFQFFDQKITQVGNKLTISDGTLAGSALDMITAVKNAVKHVGIELTEALNMASLYPAQYLGVEHNMGTISVGKQADLVLFSSDYQVQKTWINGQVMFEQTNNAQS